jgi:hypothetical protein
MSRLQLNLESLRRLDPADAGQVLGAALSETLDPSCGACGTSTCMTYTTIHSSLSRTVTGVDAK